MSADRLAEDAWSSEFQTGAPRPILNSLQRRLQASSTHAHALAELFRERAVVEQEYSAKLAKLAQAAESGQLLGKNGVEWDRRGGEAKLWDAVVSDIQETSSSHSTLAAMLKTDYETPVRELPNKITAWRRIADQESSLDRTLKDQEKTAAKLDKAMSKTKSTKTEQLHADLNQLTSSVASLSPMVYTTFQRLDEERLNTLKEVIVRWSTARADMAARDGERAEASVAKLLSWEPIAEVESVGHRIAQAGGGTPGGTPRSQAANHNAQPPGTPTRRLSMQTTGSATGDFTPRMSKVNASNSNVSATGTPSGGGGFSGFKSLLTRKATTANRQRSGSEAASTRSSRRPTGTSDVFESLDERPGEQGDGFAAQTGKPTQRREREPSTTQSLHGPPVDAEGFSVPPADRHRNPWEDPNELIPTPASAHGPSAANAGVALPSAIFAGTKSSSPVVAQEFSNSPTSSHDGAAPKLNLALASTPIQESDEARQAALAKMQQTLQMAPQAANRRSTMRGRRGDRHTMQATASETPLPANHMAALARIGDGDNRADDDTPLATIKQEALRQRSASSQSNRNPFESPSGGQGSQAEVSSPHTGYSNAALGGVVGGGLGAAAGIAGGAALANHSNSAEPKAEQVAPPPASQLHDSPVTATGATPALRATIVERVDAHMKDYLSQRTAVTGEIFFSVGTAAPPSNTTVHVKLTSFDSLDSIAPDPTFLAQVPDQPGEYYLNCQALVHAIQSGGTGADQRGVLLFRYQVLVPEGSENSVVPVALNPAFQVKDGETRMILHYRVNPGSAVSNLDLSVLFPSEPEVTATQSKPVTGTWSDVGADRRVTWKPQQVQEGADGKVITRYVTAPGAPHLVPKSVDAHFVCAGRLVSGINLEAVGNPGVLEGVDLSTVSGSYVGEPTLNQ